MDSARDRLSLQHSEKHAKVIKWEIGLKNYYGDIMELRHCLRLQTVKSKVCQNKVVYQEVQLYLQMQ